MQHNLIESEVQARKRDYELRTVTSKGGRMVTLAELQQRLRFVKVSD
jgi:hypothetical protein